LDEFTHYNFKPTIFEVFGVAYMDMHYLGKLSSYKGKYVSSAIYPPKSWALSLDPEFFFFFLQK
jgi:hypothetical protein